MELYCGDKQVQRNIIQSIIPIGSILGLLIVNSLSDIKGRKFALVFVQIVGIIGVGRNCKHIFSNSFSRTLINSMDFNNCSIYMRILWLHNDDDGLCYSNIILPR